MLCDNIEFCYVELRSELAMNLIDYDVMSSVDWDTWLCLSYGRRVNRVILQSTACDRAAATWQITAGGSSKEVWLHGCS
jgi:hypothetical protein